MDRPSRSLHVPSRENWLYFAEKGHEEPVFIGNCSLKGDWGSGRQDPGCCLQPPSCLLAFTKLLIENCSGLTLGAPEHPRVPAGREQAGLCPPPLIPFYLAPSLRIPGEAQHPSRLRKDWHTAEIAEEELLHPFSLQVETEDQRSRRPPPTNVTLSGRSKARTQAQAGALWPATSPRTMC